MIGLFCTKKIKPSHRNAAACAEPPAARHILTRAHRDEIANANFHRRQRIIPRVLVLQCFITGPTSISTLNKFDLVDKQVSMSRVRFRTFCDVQNFQKKHERSTGRREYELIPFVSASQPRDRAALPSSPTGGPQVQLKDTIRSGFFSRGVPRNGGPTQVCT